MKKIRMGIFCWIITFIAFSIFDYIRNNTFKLSESLLESFIFSVLLIFFLWLATNKKK